MCRLAVSFHRLARPLATRQSGAVVDIQLPSLRLTFFFAFLCPVSGLLIARECDYERLNFNRFDQKSTVIEAEKAL